MTEVVLKDWMLNNVPSHIREKFLNQLAKWDTYKEDDRVKEYVLIAQLQFVKQ